MVLKRDRHCFCFDQTTPVRDSDTDSGNNASVSTLSIEPDDMVVGSFSTTGQSSSNSTGNTGELNPYDSWAGADLEDDPTEACYKEYQGASTTTGSAGWSGGGGTRTGCVFAVIQRKSPEAGNIASQVTTIEDKNFLTR